MEKVLTFKRKVYEVEAIQFKGEENIQAVLDLLAKHNIAAESRHIAEYEKHGHVYPEVTIVDFQESEDSYASDWEMLNPGYWIIIKSGYAEMLDTEDFARKYEGV